MFLAIAISSLALRIWNSAHYPIFNHRTHFELPNLRFDSLFFGVFLAYLHAFHPEALGRIMSTPWRLPIALRRIGTLAPAAVLTAANPFVYTFGFTLAYVGFGILLLLGLYPERPGSVATRRPVARYLAVIGFYSYTIYLWHLPMAEIFAAIARALPMLNQYALHAVYVPASIGVGIGFSKLLEIPVLKIRDRLLPVKLSRQIVEEQPSLSI